MLSRPAHRNCHPGCVERSMVDEKNPLREPSRDTSGQRHRTIQAPDDHPEDLIRDLFCRTGLLVTAPLQPRSEDRPAHHGGYDLRGRRLTVSLVLQYLDPTEEQLVEFVLYTCLDEGPKPTVRPRAGSIEPQIGRAHV